MERNFWRTSYSSFGHFACPRCRQGRLRERGEIVRGEPDHVSRELHNEGLIGEISIGRFSGLLVCNSKSCGEIVAVAGDYRTDYERQQDQDTDEEIVFSNHEYRPFCFRPAPEIITYPKVLAKDIQPHLKRAFELFWSDHGSCANRLRIIVEMVLDQLGVPRTGQKGGRKNARWDLSDRITDLSAKRPGHDDVLNALRKVGNTGSHEGVVELEDLLDCFELLEYALIELLEQRREKLAAKALRLMQPKAKATP